MLLPTLGLKVRDNETLNDGVIVDVNYWLPGTLSSVNHGTLAVKLVNPEGQDYNEHYTIYNWSNYLTVIE